MFFNMQWNEAGRDCLKGYSTFFGNRLISPRVK